jgi:uncharacterized membrane protein YccC
MLTIVIIMKPGFALTRQRNGWRLTGTLIGCVMALILINLTGRSEILFIALLFACIMGNSLVQLNYMASAIFNTIFVVLVFHFVSPGTLSMNVIGERALDTLIGCALSLACSYAFPWWEARYLPPLARAAIKANREYLKAGRHYAIVMREKLSRRQTPDEAQGPVPEAPATQAEIDADVSWRFARRNVHIAFGNFAEAFYRMMSEPLSRQQYVPELNNLLIQNHVLASQTTAVVPTLATLAQEPPPSITSTLDSVVAMLDPEHPPVPPVPEQIDTQGDLASLAYPLKLMVRAGQMIRHESMALDG